MERSLLDISHEKVVQDMPKVLSMLIDIMSWHHQGQNLQQITRLTYLKREENPRNWIYFGWGTKSVNPDASYLYAQPTKKQPEFYDKFQKPVEELGELTEYSLHIYESGRMELTHRILMNGKIKRVDWGVFGGFMLGTDGETRRLSSIQAILQNTLNSL